MAVKKPAVKESAEAPKEPKGSSKATEINRTFGGSAVTTNIGGSAPAEKDENRPRTFADRASDASIGLVRVEGMDWRYVGIAPARDKGAETPGGIPITTENSTFRPLSEVPFDSSIRVKIGDEYFFPDASATGWQDVVNSSGKSLVPAK